MTLQQRIVVVGEKICTDRFDHYNRTPVPLHSREGADYVPATRYQAQARQCSVTASVVKHTLLSVNSSPFHRISSSASTLPLPDSLQYVKLAVPTIPGSDANLHDLFFSHHSHLEHASSTSSSRVYFSSAMLGKNYCCAETSLASSRFLKPGYLTCSNCSHERSKVLPLSALRAFFCSRVHASAPYGLYYSVLWRRISITVCMTTLAATFSPNLPEQHNLFCTHAHIFQVNMPFR